MFLPFAPVHAGGAVSVMHISADRLAGPFLKKANPVQILRLYAGYRRFSVDQQRFAKAPGKR
jgi:hypothetical protein